MAALGYRRRDGGKTRVPQVRLYMLRILEHDSLLSKNSVDIITQKSEQVFLQLPCLPSACTAEGEVAGGEPYIGSLEK